MQQKRREFKAGEVGEIQMHASKPSPVALIVMEDART